MNLNDEIKEFFTNDRRKGIKIAAVEKEAGVPKNTLLNLITIGRKIPEKHLQSIATVLKTVGFK